MLIDRTNIVRPVVTNPIHLLLHEPGNELLILGWNNVTDAIVTDLHRTQLPANAIAVVVRRLGIDTERLRTLDQHAYVTKLTPVLYVSEFDWITRDGVVRYQHRMDTPFLLFAPDAL